MFTKKVSKSQSASKLLKILTKRSSDKTILRNKGIYDEWPNATKPSLFNYPANYIKHVNNQEKQQQNVIRTKTPKGQRKLKKVPATFSVCTTVEFYAPNQQKTKIFSKFTSTSQKQESNKQLTQNHNFFLSDQKFDNFNEESFEEMSSKYSPVKISHQRKSSDLEKRLVKTAKVNRRKIEISGDLMAQTFHESRKTNIRPLTGNIQRSNTNKTLFEPQIDQSFEKKTSYLSFSRLNPKLVSQSQEIFSKYPLRLKDYETNFQAYKVISELIDSQMKWQPKRLRPKTSVGLRKNQNTLKY